MRTILYCVYSKYDIIFMKYSNVVKSGPQGMNRDYLVQLVLISKWQNRFVNAIQVDPHEHHNLNYMVIVGSKKGTWLGLGTEDQS